jgi:hypothetical protein
LFQRHIPDLYTPHCRCGTAPEAVAHPVLYCPDIEEEREELSEITGRTLRNRGDFMALATDPETAGTLTKWLLSLGRLQEFRLAVQRDLGLEREREEVEGAATALGDDREGEAQRAGSLTPTSPVSPS